MLSGINTSALSQLYRSQGSEYSTLITKIASGKEISKPSDDFVGYTRASGIEQDIEAYKDINVNLTEIREGAQMASDLGNGIYEDLTRMKELAELYSSASAADQATYKSEFDALGAGITNTIANNKYGGNTVVASGTLAEANINPDDNTSKLSVAFVAGDIADASSLDITAGSAVADVQAELEAATSYSVKADGYLNQIDRQVEINENLITSKDNTSSAITDLDEVKALAEATELQVRQQATVSMIAQANLVTGNVARLYQ